MEVASELEIVVKEDTPSNSEEVLMARDRLHEELGDVAFDCLMLIAICSRDHPSSGPSSAYGLGATKIKSRVSYIWGHDTADTPQEAQAIWQKAKERERAEKIKAGQIVNAARPSPGGWFDVALKAVVVIGGCSAIAFKFKLHKHPSVSPFIQKVTDVINL